MALKKNIIANYLGKGWTTLMGVAFLPVYIKFLGIEAVGLIGVVALMQSWFALLDMGMTPTLNREMARHTSGAVDIQHIRDLLRSLELLAFALAVGIGLCVFAAAGYIATHWIESGSLPAGVVANVISIISLVLGLRLCEGIYRGALMGLQKQVFVNVVTCVLATLRYAGVLAVLSYYSNTIEAFFAWQAVVSVVSVATLAVSLHLFLPAAPAKSRASLAALRRVRQFAGGMLGIALLSVLLTQLDKILLSKYLTLEKFGYYTLASMLASVLYMFVGPITLALYPRLVEQVASGNESGFRNTFHLGSQIVSTLITPLGLLICAFSGGIVYAWSGDPALVNECGTLTTLLAFGTMLHTLVHVPYYCQLAHGWTSLSIYINIVAIVILLPALLLVVPVYGGLGAAWIWIALNLGYICFNAQFMHKRILTEEKLAWYHWDLAVPIAGALLVILTSRWLMPRSYESRIVWLIFLAATGLSASAAAAMLSNCIRPQIIACISYPFPLSKNSSV